MRILLTILLATAVVVLSGCDNKFIKVERAEMGFDYMQDKETGICFAIATNVGMQSWSPVECTPGVMNKIAPKLGDN